MPGTTTTTQMSNVKAREVDFVSRFNTTWQLLTDVLGISRPIRKAPGSTLVSYVASMTDSALQTTTTEGGLIPFTQYKVEPAATATIEIKKYAKQVSIESVEKYGAEIAVEKTDDAFLGDLLGKVLTDFYTTINAGRLTGSQKTWQRALAIAKGAVEDRFAGLHKSVSGVVGFANIMDYYNWLGDQQITVQTLNGIQYIKDFMGYRVLFLLPASAVAANKVIAMPVENLNAFFVDPSDSQFAKLGLNYTADSEIGMIGVHAEGDYAHAAGNIYAIMGITLWPEYADGIAVVTVNSSASNTNPTVSAS